VRRPDRPPVGPPSGMAMGHDPLALAAADLPGEPGFGCWEWDGQQCHAALRRCSRRSARGTRRRSPLPTRGQQDHKPEAPNERM
jgi:hypothetical protein